MRFSTFVVLAIAICVPAAIAQVKAQPTPSKIPAGVPVKPGTSVRPIAGVKTVDPGSVSGRTYTNKQLNFEVTLPDAWLIPDSDYEAYMKAHGVNIRIVEPLAIAPQDRAVLSQYKKNVTLLLTGFTKMPGTPDWGIMLVSVEDLSAHPEIKDAVDYFDEMRATFAKMKLPVGFKYSETQAEQLGLAQFGFIDVTTNAGRRRMYAIVRNGYAVMFTLSYTDSADLTDFRKILEIANFKLQ